MKPPIRSVTTNAGPEPTTTDQYVGLKADLINQAASKKRTNAVNGNLANASLELPISQPDSSEDTELVSDEFPNSPNGGCAGIQYDSEPT